METTSPRPSMWQRSTTRRLLRWLFSWRTIRRALVGLACLVTLIALAYTIENWRGKRAWMEFKTRMEAKGEHFDLASLVPKPVPDEQNFAMTPLLKPLLNYTVTNGVVWHDPEGLRRAEAVDVQIAMPEPLPDFGMPPPGAFEPVADPATPSALPAPNTTPPKLGRWTAGRHTHLEAWQAFYQGNTNYPAPARPGTAAEDVLTALSKFDAELAELRTAATRPYSVFPVHYEEGIEIVFKHLGVLRKMAYLPVLRATALLDAGESEEALRDVELGLRLTEALKSEPTLISQLVRIALLQIALQPVWEGMADGRWNDAQLTSLQSRLQKLRLLEGYPLAIRGENVIFIGRTVDRLRSADYSLEALGNGGGPQPYRLQRILTRAVPDGWLYQNQLVCSRLLLEQFLPVVDPERQRVDPDAIEDGVEALNRLVARRTPYNLLASILLPAYGKIAMKFAHAQCSVDLAAVACALERHRLAHGQYPESLDALAQQFIARLPHDVITGQPLKYRRTDDGRFALYSVGWNQQDDGGGVVLSERGDSVDDAKGDWVWRYPENAE